MRDKDAVVASMLICEMAAYYRTKGISMIQARDNMYKKYGVFRHSLQSFTFEGESGMHQMKALMQQLRDDRPEEIGGLKVVAVSDYQASLTTNVATGEQTAITLPKSNVLVFALENHAKVVIRPSGTEPKIKTYYTTVGATMEEATALEEKLIADFSQMFK